MSFLGVALHFSIHADVRISYDVVHRRYGPFKKWFDDLLPTSPSSPSSMLSKMASGLSAGAVASAFITPVDIVMIRQFVEGGRISSSTGTYVGG